MAIEEEDDTENAGTGSERGTVSTNETKEEDDETDDTESDDSDDDTSAHVLNLNLGKQQTVESELIRGMMVSPTSVVFTKLHTITVSEKCAVVAIEGRHVWVAYHVGDNLSLEEFDFGGKMTYKTEVGETVRRIASDGIGRVYMSCREAQCIKIADANTDTVSTMITTSWVHDGNPSELKMTAFGWIFHPNGEDG